MVYSPWTKVYKLIEDYGQQARIVLDAYNSVDPLQIYFGEDCNPDEYTEYARRFLALKAEEEIFALIQPITQAVVEELVRRSFHPAEIAESKWVTLEQVHKITLALWNSMALLLPPPAIAQS